MKYEVRRREDGKKAIFDEKGNMISPEWFDEIEPYGLVRGQSNLYVALKDGKSAIFDENGNMITPEWFDGVFPFGLVVGRSNYYFAVKDNKLAIFDKDGNMITPGWFNWIFPNGLVEGECDYYLACNSKTCAVYHKDGQKVSEDFSIVYLKGVESVRFNESLGIVNMFDEDFKLIKTIEFKPVYPDKDETIDYTKPPNI